MPAQSAPRLFHGLLPAASDLLHASSPALRALAVQVLARAGRHRPGLAALAPLSRHPAADHTVPNELPQDLSKRLVRMCRSGPPKAAKMAPVALYHLLDPDAGREQLAQLCRQLAGALTPAKVDTAAAANVLQVRVHAAWVL